MTMYQVSKNGQKNVGLYASKSTAELIAELNQKRDARTMSASELRKVRYTVTVKVVG